MESRFARGTGPGRTRVRAGMFVALFCALVLDGGVRRGHVEGLPEETLDPENEAGYQDVLADLESSPVDLNTASSETIASIPGVSVQDAVRIVAFRRRHGRFRRVHDLLSVEGMTEEVMEAIELYAIVSAPERSLRVRGDARVRVMWKRPYDGGSFEGLGTYQRARFSLGEKAQAALLVEKDPGEMRCADLAVGYLELRGVPGLDRMVIGDFRPGFGQALVLGRQARAFSGIGFAKRGESKPVGYASATENAGLRGLFLSGTFGVVRGAAFLSNVRRDATLDEEGEVLRLRESGLHVSSSEKAGADVLSEALIGGRIALHPEGPIRVGMTALHLRFDRPFVRGDVGAFYGRRSRSLGIDWGVEVSRFDLFGEIARSSPGGYGAVLGTILRLGPLRTTVLLRRYARDFWSFYGSGFSATGGPRNERGIFTAMTWRPARRTKISAFFDHHRRPWRTDRLPMPSQGHHVGARLEGSLCRGSKVVLHMRSKANQVWSDCGLRDLRRRSFRGELIWCPEPRLRFKGRMERTAFDLGRGREKGDGVSLTGDVRIQPWRWVTLDARVTFFDTDAHNARIYEFEGDMPGRMSVAVLNGRGCRKYILARIKREKYQVSARYWCREVLPRGGPDEGGKTSRESRGSFQVDVKF